MGTTPNILPRQAEAALADRLRRAPVVVVTGARQTGKTTLVQAVTRANRVFITLDSVSALDRARTDAEVLFARDQDYIVDEVQLAPEVLLAVKRLVDAGRRPGRFILTGSSNLLLMKGVSETLAGRSAHLTLRPLTPRELRGDASHDTWGPLLSAADPRGAIAAISPASPFAWREFALRGGLPPAALATDPDDRAVWFDGYVETWLQRDLRDLAQVGDLPAFSRLIRLAALRTGGLVNFADLASDAGIPRSTVQRWLGILETSYFVAILPPFFESKAKRIIKTPKLYTLDSGLGLYLCGISTAAEIDESASRGAWLEQLVLNDLLAWRDLHPRKPGIFFRRTSTGEEIDFVVEHGRRLLPIEVKSARAVKTTDARALDAFCDEFGSRAPFALLLYDGADTVQLTARTIAAPLGAVL